MRLTVQQILVGKNIEEARSVAGGFGEIAVSVGCGKRFCVDLVNQAGQKKRIDE